MINNSLKSKIFLWIYRIFGYFIPLGISLWFFLIEKLLDTHITFASKVGISGIFVLVVILFIAIYFYKKHFAKKIEKLNKDNSEFTDKILLETDETKKAEYLETKKAIRNALNKTEMAREIFNNILFVAPFVLCYIVCVLIEKEMISLRGFFLMLTLSMAIGFGFNVLSQLCKYKTDKIRKVKVKKQKVKKETKAVEIPIQENDTNHIVMG